MILLRSNVPLKLETTLEKGKKIGTLTHIILVAHSKSIEWIRQKINGSISMQPKHFPDMKKIWETGSKDSQTHHLNRISPYNPQRMWEILKIDPSHSHKCNRAALMRFSMMTKQNHFVLLICHNFHCLLFSNQKS